MNRVLQEIRRLEKAHRRGEIGDAEYASVRAALTALIEEAELVEDDPAPAVADADTPAELWRQALLVGAALAVLTWLAAWYLQDVTTALTLLAAVLCWLTLRAFRRLEAEETAAAPEPDEP